MDNGEECDDGNNIDGDECDSTCRIETGPPEADSCEDGESLLELVLQTDQWSRSENYMYLYDDATPQDEWIWKIDRFGFDGNTEYNGTACLQPSNCYKFFFFDAWGDGLLSGSLTLTLDGNEVLAIVPGDVGTIFEEGSVTTYWAQSFGPCTSGNN